MPVFKRVEIVDARQFTGGTQNGTDLSFWVQSKEGHAEWRSEGSGFPEHVKVDCGRPYSFSYAYVGDWIMQNQDGSFRVVRQQELDALYEQV